MNYDIIVLHDMGFSQNGGLAPYSKGEKNHPFCHVRPSKNQRWRGKTTSSMDVSLGKILNKWWICTLPCLIRGNSWVEIWYEGGTRDAAIHHLKVWMMACSAEIFSRTVYPEMVWNGGFHKMDVPQIIQFSRIFHRKPSFWKHLETKTHNSVQDSSALQGSELKNSWPIAKKKHRKKKTVAVPVSSSTDLLVPSVPS